MSPSVCIAETPFFCYNLDIDFWPLFGVFWPTVQWFDPDHGVKKTALINFVSNEANSWYKE